MWRKVPSWRATYATMFGHIASVDDDSEEDFSDEDLKEFVLTKDDQTRDNPFDLGSYLNENYEEDIKDDDYEETIYEDPILVDAKKLAESMGPDFNSPEPYRYNLSFTSAYISDRYSVTLTVSIYFPEVGFPDIQLSVTSPNYIELEGYIHVKSLDRVLRKTTGETNNKKVKFHGLLSQLAKIAKDWFEANLEELRKEKEQQMKPKMKINHKKIKGPKVEPLIMSGSDYLDELLRKQQTSMECKTFNQAIFDEIDVEDYNLEDHRVYKDSAAESLKSRCLLSIAQNLFLYEDFSEVPKYMKIEILNYLTTYFKIHPKHLELILDTDFTHLDLSLQKETITTLHAYPISKKAINLTSLNLSNATKLADQGINLMSKTLHKLTRIDFSNTTLLTSESSDHLATGCPNLRYITLINCPWVDNLTIWRISNRCNYLTEIHVSHAPKLSGSCMFDLIQKSGNIKIINVTHCGSKVCSQNIPKIQKIKSVLLESLILDYNHWVTTDFVLGLFSLGLPSLTKLSLIDSSMVESNIFGKIIWKLPKLKEVNCTNFCSETLRVMCGSNLNLTKIDCKGNNIISTHSVLNLLIFCKQLEDLSVNDCSFVDGKVVIQQLWDLGEESKLKILDISNTKKCFSKNFLNLKGCELLCLKMMHCNFDIHDLWKGDMWQSLYEIDVSHSEGFKDCDLENLQSNILTLKKLNISNTIVRGNFKYNHLFWGKLEVLYVGLMYNMKDIDLAEMILHCPSLVELDVTGSHEAVVYNAIGQNLFKLKKLVMCLKPVNRPIEFSGICAFKGLEEVVILEHSLYSKTYRPLRKAMGEMKVLITERAHADTPYHYTRVWT